jgi:hypothetical protein
MHSLKMEMAKIDEPKPMHSQKDLEALQHIEERARIAQ